jgi:hypothetical protein
MKISDTDIKLIKDFAISELLASERKGIENLVDFMNSNDYFDAPASKGHHHNYENGLLIHSYDVHINFTVNLSKFGFDPSRINPAIVAYGHDICKHKQYQFQYGNIAYNNVELDKGHGKYSVEILEKFIKLTYAEKAIIQFHMGDFYTSELNTEHGEYPRKLLSATLGVHPELLTFIYADVKSTGEVNREMQNHLNLLHANTESTVEDFTFIGE